MRDFAHLIEPDILVQIEDLSEVTVNRAHVLGLTHNRFDLAFKLYYLQGLDAPVRSAYREDCYRQHIRAFSGVFAEPNNPDKNTYGKFKQVFDELFRTISTHGFDAQQSLIPLAENGSILNGAHRTAVAIFLGKPVGTVHTRLAAPPFNYQFFGKRGVPVDMLDVAAQTYAEYDDGCFLAVVWPAARGREQEIESILSPVVYRKRVRLNYNGAHNLLAEAYRDEPWIGSPEKNLPGIRNKLVACFPDFGDVRIYLFKAGDQEHVRVRKQMVRDLFDLGNHAIHITNNQEETLRLARLLFNRSGLHFLNHGFPRRFFAARLASPAEQNSTASHAGDRAVFDEELTMEAYGLRQAAGSPGRERADRPATVDADVQDTNPLHPEIHGELMDDPDHFFAYQGIRLISLKQVYAMKAARRNQQDIADMKLIGPMVRENFLQEKWGVMCQSVAFRKFVFSVKTRQIASDALRKVGLLDAAKKLLRQIGRDS